MMGLYLHDLIKAEHLLAPTSRYYHTEGYGLNV